MAQLERFRMENKSFCTLECMVAAFPLAHSNVELQAGRKIVPAPARELLWKMKRSVWLEQCRVGLSENDLKKVQEESIVLQTRKRL